MVKHKVQEISPFFTAHQKEYKDALTTKRMVFIYLNQGKSTYVMVDGYTSSHQPNMNKSGLIHAINKTRSSLDEHCSDANTQKYLPFDRIVSQLRKDFCNEHKIGFQCDGKHPCFYKSLDFKAVDKLLKDKANCYKRNRWMDLRKYLPFLSTEHENDIKKGRKNYTQSIIILDEPICSYSTMKKCCSNWIHKTSFRFKKTRDYIDYEHFVTAWLDILDRVFNDTYICICGSNLI